MEKKKIYVVVKTYPTISDKYSELVCTAGLLENGTWIRLYPVPYRKLDEMQRYKKYSWIEANVEKNPKDFRPESYRPQLESIEVISPPEKPADWDKRRQILTQNQKIYTNITELIEQSRQDNTSLAIFKPTIIKDLIFKEVERNQEVKKVKSLDLKSRQLTFFQTPEETKREYKIVNKVPYKFSYIIEDDERRESKMMIEDWEIGALYFNCLTRANGDERTALAKVKEKYFDYFSERGILLFLGTTLRHHKGSPNPFIIVGVFYPPYKKLYSQLSLF